MASKERKECARDFRWFAKKTLDGDEGASLSEPSFGADTAETYFRTVYHSDQRSFQTPEWLPVAPSPHHPFDERPFTQHDLEAVIKRSKVRSSPSPLAQVPYLVFKRCPSLNPLLPGGGTVRSLQLTSLILTISLPTSPLQIYDLIWSCGQTQRGHSVLENLPFAVKRDSKLLPKGRNDATWT